MERNVHFLSLYESINLLSVVLCTHERLRIKCDTINSKYEPMNTIVGLIFIVFFTKGSRNHLILIPK